MVAARRRRRRTVGLRTLSGSILVAQAKQVEVRSAQVRYQARPGRLLGAARLAPAGPPLRAFAATAAARRLRPLVPRSLLGTARRCGTAASDRAGAAAEIGRAACRERG